MSVRAEPELVSEAVRDLSLRAELIQVRNELAALLETLTAADEQPAERAHEHERHGDFGGPQDGADPGAQAAALARVLRLRTNFADR